MRRKKKRVIIIITVFILCIIGLLFYRSGSLEHLRISKEKPEQQIALMTNTQKVRDAGEQLLVSIVGERGENPIIQNITAALTYAKVPFEFIRPADIAALQPSPYHVLMVTNEASNEWPYEEVRRFVTQGGRFFVATRYWNAKWNELVGIRAVTGFLPKVMSGLTFEEELFPGYPSVQQGFPNNMLSVMLEEKAKVYIRSENVPMLWTYPYGKGKVVYWNATFLSAKSTRGLITQSLGLAVPSFVSGQAAVKVMFIDDFPAPIPVGDVPSIRRDYKMTTERFFRDVWWKDMKQLAHQYNLQFTNVFIGTYENNSRLTAEQLAELMREPMLYFGRQSVRLGYELGFHGYNHQPLVVQGETLSPEFGYMPWKSAEQMQEAIRISRALFDRYFPNQKLQVYVPPSNVLNQTGLHALVEGLPSLRVIASLYQGDVSKGAFVQEFGQDEVYKDIYHLPRVSSGYEQDAGQEFAVRDVIANFGVFNHFVHPDDILDPVRSKGQSWEGMREGFGQFLEKISKTYPYLKGYTASKAREKLVRYEEADLRVYYKENAITITGERLVNPSDVLVRLEDGKYLESGTVDGYKVRKLPGADSVYAVTLTKPLITIPVKDGA